MTAFYILFAIIVVAITLLSIAFVRSYGVLKELVEYVKLQEKYHNINDNVINNLVKTVIDIQKDVERLNHE